MNRPVWSYTLLNTYWTCPKQAYHRYIAKDLPRVESEGMKWGIRVHEAMARRISRQEPLPEEMQKWEPLAAPVAALPGVRAELKMGMTETGQPCDFFAPDVWGRGVIDVLTLNGNNALILDWKTGKRREDPTELQIFAMLLRCMEPAVTKITGRYVWLHDGVLGDAHDVGDDSAVYERVLRADCEIEDLLDSGAEWPAQKNGLCRQWCDVLTCAHNGRREK